MNSTALKNRPMYYLLLTLSAVSFSPPPVMGKLTHTQHHRPSGAGKTTLISSLTLDALYGYATGSVTLNGVPLTDEIFKQHCYVVKQHDKHWPYLTCRETLAYAAELYDVVEKSDLSVLVDEIIRKMGMESCADTKNSALSGGQRRRLSIGVALLKQPTLLFLESELTIVRFCLEISEPTSGLDAAAASSIMQEIVRVAKEERIIVVCTIHQPSTKVYNGFDQLMIMSRGRQAYSGDVNDAVTYFEGIGYSCPPAMNPAEFFLDLVNSDFTDEAAVTAILDTWEEKRPDGGSSSHHKKGFAEDDGQEGVTKVQKAPLRKEMVIMFRRHSTLILRDPILYIGRCGIFLAMCLVFALVYLSGRDNSQDQTINKFWLMVWFIGVPSNMGVVAVYALNDEFKSIIRENKNGMVTPLSYVLAKTILVFPWFFIFALFAHGIPLYLVQDAPGEAFVIELILYAAIMFVFESVAETLSVWFEDPSHSKLTNCFIIHRFGCFVFGGFLIPKRDLYWPFELFYYIMPFSYYVRSSVHELFKNITFETCKPPGNSPVCMENGDGSEILTAFNRIMPLVSEDDTTVTDLVILIVIGVVWKLFYIAGVVYKTSRVSKFNES
eukprot:scaffold1484_cov173-Amphora_coffeaeformis.AAC.17